jgi:hypothetical protein
MECGWKVLYLAGVFAFFGFFFSRRCLSLLIAVSMPRQDGGCATANFQNRGCLFVIRLCNSNRASRLFWSRFGSRGTPCKWILRRRRRGKPSGSISPASDPAKQNSAQGIDQAGAGKGRNNFTDVGQHERRITYRTIRGKKFDGNGWGRSLS